jgi:hypothetical protein
VAQLWLASCGGIVMGDSTVAACLRFVQHHLHPIHQSILDLIVINPSTNDPHHHLPTTTAARLPPAPRFHPLR